MSEGEAYPGFAPEHDAPIPYMQRIRDYYQELGYGAPYRWAHYAGVPFQPLEKPLANSRVALITTAAPYQPGKGDQGPGAPYNAAAKFYSGYSGDTPIDHALRISHVGIDRVHTSAEDSAPWFPLRDCVAARRRAGSARSHAAFTARRPTAAIAPRSRATAPSCWRDAAPMAPTPPFSSPIDRCVTRP